MINNVTGWSAGWQAISKRDILESLGEIVVPILALAGQHDAASPVGNVEKIARCARNGRFALVPRSAHMQRIEQTETFSRYVIEFLDEVLPR